MNQPSFLNEKEQAAADNLLTLLVGLTVEGARQTDVEALCKGYAYIHEAASIRHCAPPNITRLATAAMLREPTNTTGSRDMTTMQIQHTGVAPDDLAIQQAFGIAQQ